MEHLSAVKCSRPYLTRPQIQNLAAQSEFDSANGSKYRIKGFNLTLRACKILNLPIRTFDVAMTLFLHCVICSASKISTDVLVGSCILLATKMQDTPKKSRDIAHILLVSLEKPHGNNENEELRSAIAFQEQQLLETIAFDFRGETPHYYTIKLGKELKLERNVVKTAWEITTDMFLTWVPLRQPPHTVALAAIILSAKLHGVQGIFPIDSAALLSERPAVNECLADVLALYIENYAISALAAGDSPQVSRGIFEGIATSINSELDKSKKRSPLEGLLLHDPKVSVVGTAEYLLFKP